MRVLHYKSNFLNYSETFIHRIIANHKEYDPVGMCIKKRKFSTHFPVFEKPKYGVHGLINTVYFHLNGCLPFYNKTIQRIKPDVIHAHFGYDGYRMIKPSLKNNIPLIVSFYGSDVTRLPNELDWKRRYKKLAKHGDSFIAASNRMKRQLIELGFPKQKIVIVPYGLDLDFFSFDKSTNKNGSLMMVGRMVEKKGFRYALEAIKFLSDTGVSVHLDLYGKGPLEKRLKKMARNFDVEDKVTFHGYVPIEQVKNEHKNHSVLLAPSVTAADGDEEGLPNTILEAMASGTLVVAADHAAICEVLSHNKTGKVVPERNARAIADSVQNILSNGNHTEEIKQNARAIIEKDFEVTNVVEQIENLYTKVIDEHYR